MNIPFLIPFSTINNITMSVNSSNFTLVFFKTTCHANPGAEKKLAGSSQYISGQIFRKLVNAPVSNNIFLWTYKWWYSPEIFISKSVTNPFCSGKIKHELRVASFEFKSTSYEFKSTRYEFKSMCYEFKFKSYVFNFTSYEIKLTS